MLTACRNSMPISPMVLPVRSTWPANRWSGLELTGADSPRGSEVRPARGVKGSLHADSLRDGLLAVGSRGVVALVRWGLRQGCETGLARTGLGESRQDWEAEALRGVLLGEQEASDPGPELLGLRLARPRDWALAEEPPLHPPDDAGLDGAPPRLPLDPLGLDRQAPRPRPQCVGLVPLAGHRVGSCLSCSLSRPSLSLIDHFHFATASA